MTTITNNKNSQSPICSNPNYDCPACGRPYTDHSPEESEDCANQP